MRFLFKDILYIYNIIMEYSTFKIKIIEENGKKYVKQPIGWNKEKNGI